MSPLQAVHSIHLFLGPAKTPPHKRVIIWSTQIPTTCCSPKHSTPPRKKLQLLFPPVHRRMPSHKWRWQQAMKPERKTWTSDMQAYLVRVQMKQCSLLDLGQLDSVLFRAEVHSYVMKQPTTRSVHRNYGHKVCWPIYTEFQTKLLTRTPKPIDQTLVWDSFWHFTSSHKLQPSSRGRKQCLLNHAKTQNLSIKTQVKAT